MRRWLCDPSPEATIDRTIGLMMPRLVVRSVAGATIDRAISHTTRRLIVRSVVGRNDWPTFGRWSLPLVARLPTTVLILPSIFSNRWWSHDHAYDQSSKTNRGTTAIGDRCRHCWSVAPWPNRNTSSIQKSYDLVWLWTLTRRKHRFMLSENSCARWHALMHNVSTRKGSFFYIYSLTTWELPYLIIFLPNVPTPNAHFNRSRPSCQTIPFVLFRVICDLHPKHGSLTKIKLLSGDYGVSYFVPLVVVMSVVQVFLGRPLDLLPSVFPSSCSCDELYLIKMS